MISGYRVEERERTASGQAQWGIKDRETGDWVEIRNIYSSSEYEAVATHAEHLNENQTPEDNAERIGRRVGRNAAEWAIEPDRMSKVQMRRILDAMECDDRRILDQFREPDLSGEFQGGYTPATLAEELGIDPEDGTSVETACECWGQAARDAYWAKIHETLLIHTQEN